MTSAADTSAESGSGYASSLANPWAGNGMPSVGCACKVLPGAPAFAGIPGASATFEELGSVSATLLPCHCDQPPPSAGVCKRKPSSLPPEPLTAGEPGPVRGVIAQ